MTNKSHFENISKNIPQEVKNLLKDIAENSKGLSVYLGGGYLRDLCTFKAPKDLDIFLAPKDEGSWDGIEYIPSRVMVNYRKNTSDISVSSDMEARGLQGLTGLFLTGLYGIKEAQYIIYKNPMTLQEVAEDFDIGICQIVYDPLTDEVYYTDNFAEGHEKKEIKCFHEYDEDRTIARFERMEKKFPDYSVVGKPEREEVEDEYYCGDVNSSTISGFSLSKKNQSNSV